MPVDYAQPDGEQVGIAVSRLRATQPAKRIGSLVFNFGGPGDAGSETLAGYAEQIPAAIRARYDLVSFDPRGTGKSRPVECVDDATADRLNAVDPTPNSDADLRQFYDGTNEPVDVVERCVARATAPGWRSSAAATWPATSIGCAPRSTTTRCPSSGTRTGP